MILAQPTFVACKSKATVGDEVDVLSCSQRRGDAEDLVMTSLLNRQKNRLNPIHSHQAVHRSLDRFHAPFDD